jgi:hypothetical protein
MELELISLYAFMVQFIGAWIALPLLILYLIIIFIEPSIVFRVGIATGLWAEHPRFDSQHGKVFLFFTASRPTLGPTQSPIQWVQGVISPGVKRPGCEADHSPPSSIRDKNGGVIPPLSCMSSWHSA